MLMHSVTDSLVLHHNNLHSQATPWYPEAVAELCNMALSVVASTSFSEATTNQAAALLNAVCSRNHCSLLSGLSNAPARMSWGVMNMAHGMSAIRTSSIWCD